VSDPPTLGGRTGSVNPGFRSLPGQFESYRCFSCASIGKSKVRRIP
jgi:hypothetical protein